MIIKEAQVALIEYVAVGKRAAGDEVVMIEWLLIRRALSMVIGFRHFHEQCYKVCLLALHVDNLSLCLGQLCLKVTHLFLEMADCPCTAINRVSDSCTGLINHAAHCISSLRLRQVLPKKKFDLINYLCGNIGFDRGKCFRTQLLTSFHFSPLLLMYTW